MSKNKLKIILGLGLLLLSIVIYFYPELFAVAGLSIAFAPVIDLYDDTAHNEEGSGIWWAQRIDKDGVEITLGQVTGVKITNPGSGYVTAPTVGFTGGGGTGAAGTAIVSNGKVVAVVMTSGGANYTGNPTSVTFTPTSGGTGAAGKAYWSDGWHLMPGKAKSDFEFGQAKTPVMDEAKKVFTTKKENAVGKIAADILQFDVDTLQFLGKDVADYHWRVFMFKGLSSTEKIYKYLLAAIVDFPKLIKLTNPAEVVPLEGIVLDNTSAITIDETKLPGGTYGSTYDIPAHEGYVIKPEGFEPTIS